ncbi:FAD-binding dehydrogenase [Paractinoplanes lichenicola]|uniref:FAD-binding dehydrogenase n=1 Tax=Paractinoplanes lichenicola TaxID=2802976 RepID=A0ABS1VRU8_9ACTN|nr:FAD-binding dehydrogenase [Actinoplanes lichenicola]MBL7257440.1 FAD-binding dehydrogenase [Actinoplanes lichenicola]
MNADVIVVGAGLSGLVATAELAGAGRSVILVEQEPAQSLGGQAFWSFGGLFLVGSPEQRRMGIRDSRELAWQDWQDNAGFDRVEDEWPRRWAEAYVDWAAGEKRAWLRSKGIKLFPIVGWAERANNSVPRFHITWGTGPGVLEPFIAAAVSSGRVTILHRHRVDSLITTGGAVTGVAGRVLAPSDVARGEASSRDEIGDFTIGAQAVVVTSGGIGGNHDLVRGNWPSRLGKPPAHMISGVPVHVDGRMLGIATAAGGTIINPDRMWHYVEGIQNWNPIWDRHGIRILPGPSSLWLDALGQRLPTPLYPGFDTLGTLAHLRTTGHDHSWFVLTQRIIEKEFALSGSEQNPDLTGRSVRQVMGRLRGGAPAPVEAFKRNGADFVVAGSLDDLVTGMNALTPAPLLDPAAIRRTIASRDRELDNDFGKDLQIAAIRGFRGYRGDRLMRTAPPHRLLDPAAGPLIAVRLHVLTRKSLGGLHTDLDGRVLDSAGAPVPGLYAAGEAAGFGGGGMHGYRALEGTFLGGCLFSGRQTARAVSAQL